MAYTKKEIEETFERIIKGIAEDGESLRSVLQRHDMPDSTIFYKWIKEDEQKSLQYACACEERADSIFEEILSIADDSSGDVKYREDGSEYFDGEFAARSRIRVDARKWVLGKMQPKKYGEKSTTILEGGEKPIEISFED